MTDDQDLRSDPEITGDDAAEGTLPAPGTPEPALSDLVEDTPRTPGRVSAAEAVTGSRARGAGAGEAPPGGIPGDDASLDGGDPV